MSDDLALLGEMAEQSRQFNLGVNAREWAVRTVGIHAHPLLVCGVRVAKEMRAVAV